MLMLVMSGVFIWWYWITVKQKSLSMPDAAETIKVAASAGTIMTLCLDVNALAFVQSTYLEWMMASQEGVWDSTGNCLGTRATRFHLFIDQINLFIGTGYMMWIIRDAIALERFSPEEISELNGHEVIGEMLKRLALNYWWIILCAVIFFGATSGIGMILFLAIEMTIMWGIVWFGNLLMKKKSIELIFFVSPVFFLKRPVLG